MPISPRVLAGGGIAAVAALVLGLTQCHIVPQQAPAAAAQTAARDRARARQLQAACASQATYDRLKEVAFDEAIRIRNADPVNLDQLATYSTVRMENPTVKSRDEALDVTVCGGRLILDLPPGAERAFGGERRLTADVEYAAQAAADGSGLVYRIKGAEPIVYKLAAFDLKGQSYGRPARSEGQIVEDIPQPLPRPQAMPTYAAPGPAERQPEPAPVFAPRVPEPAPQIARASPSFNCRLARSRSERMICSSPGLAALDRDMSSRFFSALSNGDGGTRTALRATRNRFLAYRERCPDEACIEQAYRDRMNEISDIAGEQ